jgi:hypothetical protein
MKRLEHNIATGVVTEIEMTPAEVKQFEAEAKAEADRIAAIAQPTIAEKLANAGLTIDELKSALGL